MTHYEMAEKLSEKMGVSLEKATEALEACDWELLDAAVLTAALAGGLVLLVLSLLCRPPISAGRKLLYTAALVAALLPVPLLLGGTDPVYGMANYLITPFLALCRLLLFLLVSVIADALRQRRDTARQRT